MRYGIYTHHPWCKRRCSYCSFNIFVDPNPNFKQWKDGIQNDWEQEKSFFQGQAYSLYFGGGTPSLAPPSIIEELIQTLHPEEDAEISLEVNPGDLRYSQLLALQKAGVNRYSVGIQSFNPKFSRLLNRSHTVHDNHQLLELFQKLHPRSWSLDLIFGLPNQSVAELQWDLDQALRHAPPHISLYGLTVEDGTPLQRGVKKGIIKPLAEEVWFAQFQTIIE
ncbi:MAG: radical SAM protein, partial [Myxococcota bacterium]|nr:radical SAM protein [Myxococcota bacterium]